MSQCEFEDKCSFLDDEMSKMPSYAKIIKKKYCENSSSGCARFVVGIKLGFDMVPKKLWPDKMVEAKRLISGS